MILLTRLNGSKLYINAEKVMTVEGTPDTIITLVDNVKYLVKEAPDDVVAKILDYHQRVHNPELYSIKEN
jgi:flagellar protein FlbD